MSGNCRITAGGASARGRVTAACQGGKQILSGWLKITTVLPCSGVFLLLDALLTYSPWHREAGEELPVLGAAGQTKVPASPRKAVFTLLLDPSTLNLVPGKLPPITTMSLVFWAVPEKHLGDAGGDPRAVLERAATGGPQQLCGAHRAGCNQPAGSEGEAGNIKAKCRNPR